MAPELIRSSPLRRCREPADVLGACLGIPVILDERLLELDFGDWEGMGWDRVPRAALDRWAADPAGFAPPSGETGAALIDRVSDVVAALAADVRPWLVMSHGGPLRLLDAMLRGDPPDLLAPSPLAGEMRVIHAIRTSAVRGGWVATEQKVRPSHHGLECGDRGEVGVRFLNGFLHAR